MHLTIRLFTVAILMAAILTACAGSAPAASTSGTAAPASANATAAPAGNTKRYTIGYAAPALVGVQPEIQKSFTQAATAKGWNVIATTSSGDPQKQLVQIQHFIDMKVNAIVAVPEDSKGICSAVADAQKAGILFYIIDNAPQGCKVNMAVLPDNQLAGQQAGDAMVERLKEKYKGEVRGKVLEITGVVSQTAVQLRSKGFADVMKQYPAIEVISRTVDWDSAQNGRVVAETFKDVPDIDGIYMHSDTTYIASTMTALRGPNKLFRRNEKGHILLIGVDASPACVNAIRNGYADVCLNQPVLDYSVIVNWIERELNGQPIAEGQVTQDKALWSPAMVKLSDVGPQLVLTTTMVTAKNVDDPGLWANYSAGQ